MLQVGATGIDRQIDRQTDRQMSEYLIYLIHVGTHSRRVRKYETTGEPMNELS
jgi:hypothetical protein